MGERNRRKDMDEIRGCTSTEGIQTLQEPTLLTKELWVDVDGGARGRGYVSGSDGPVAVQCMDMFVDGH